MRYLFTGPSEMVYPGYLTDAGTLVVLPGDVVEFGDHQIDSSHFTTYDGPDPEPAAEGETGPRLLSSWPVVVIPPESTTPDPDAELEPAEPTADSPPDPAPSGRGRNRGAAGVATTDPAESGEPKE